MKTEECERKIDAGCWYFYTAFTILFFFPPLLFSNISVLSVVITIIFYVMGMSFLGVFHVASWYERLIWFGLWMISLIVFSFRDLLVYDLEKALLFGIVVVVELIVFYMFDWKDLYLYMEDKHAR